MTGAVRRAEAERSARAFSWYDFLPIAAISGGWLGPIVLFWLSAFGPLRSFEDAADPTPHVGWFLAGVAICVLPRWTPGASAWSILRSSAVNPSESALRPSAVRPAWSILRSSAVNAYFVSRLT